MPVRIKSLHIQGFKALADTTLHWHPRVNVIAGANNSGKTTVLEAMALWVEIYDRIVSQAGKSISKRGIQRGEWYLDTALVHYNEITSVRSPGFHDLFHRDSQKLTLTAAFSDSSGNEVVLPLEVRRARGDHYELTVALSERDSAIVNRRLNEALGAWPSPFRVLFASPVAAVQTQEEFLSPGKVQAMVHQRRSAEVLRNRLFRLHNRGVDFQRFSDDVSRVLSGAGGRIEFEVAGNPNRDVLVRVNARNVPGDSFRDISLLGSGSLQIIEVLLNLYLDPRDLDIVLLDEPDSHIHRDIQQRLFEVIEEKADHAQVFATTHNEALLRSVPWDRVFHLTPTAREIRAVGTQALAVSGRQKGLISSPLRSVLGSVGGETALDLLSALEARYFLLVEGGSDAVVVDRLLDLARMGGPRESAMYWSLSGVDDGLRALGALRVVLAAVRNGRSLWDKAKLVLDRDFLTAEQAASFARALHEKFGIVALYWGARNVEAALLSGGPCEGLGLAVRRVGEASGLLQAGGAGDPHDACARAWDSLRSRLSVEWDEARLTRFCGALEQRVKLAEDVLGKKSPFASVGQSELSQGVIDFHRRESRSGHLWESASKQDVAEFVADVLHRLGAAEDASREWTRGPNWLQMLVREIRDFQDFPALAAMREGLRER